MDEVLFLTAHPSDGEELISLSQQVWHVDIILDNKEIHSALAKKDYTFLLFDFEAGSLYPPDILKLIYTTHPFLPIFLLSREHCYFIQEKTAASTHLAGCFRIPYEFNVLYTEISARLYTYHNAAHHTKDIEALYSCLQGKSTYIQTVRNAILEVSKENGNVLLSGESGTGKEVTAALIHKYSANNHGSYLTINSRCINEKLAESILFGSCKGAFTGAVDQDGVFIEAHQGTLFLDEIETLPIDLQAKLLRVLETHEFYKLGGKKKHRSNFRLICATNQDLSAMINTGTFRDDLFFRINIFHINMPPLRRHKEDIALLADEYLKKRDKHLSRNGLQLLKAHTWPGNIRELFHCLQRAVIHARDSNIIYPEHIDI